MRLAIAAGLTAALIVLASGCTDQYAGRYAVKGSAKLKGQAIKSGTVSFEPVDGQDTRATATIKDGAYDVSRAYGLKKGKYLIRVSAGDGKTAVNPVDSNSPPGPGGGSNIISKELVPKDWNVNSKQERSVAEQNPNVIDFDIP